MRVHLRGIVLGVAVLLSVVIAISIFNAYDSMPETKHTRTRSAAGKPDDEEAGPSPRSRKSGPKAHNSRSSPRSSTRLRAQGGARGRAGGAGARARPGAARAGGPGAGGAGGPGGPRARANRMDDDDNVEDMEIDETPVEDVEEEEPRARPAAGRVRPGKVRGHVNDDDDHELIGPGRRQAASKKRAGQTEDDEDDEDDEEEETEEVEEKEENKKEDKKKKKEEKEEEKEEEKPVEPPKKKEPEYPDWWKKAYERSAVWPVRDQFAGDEPLFPACPGFAVGATGLKMKRYGYVEQPHYVQNSKNPCWFEFNGKKDIVKCVPYFYIAGAAKSATADLLNRLHGHPNVLESATIAHHWWDRQRYGAPKAMKYTREAKRSDDVMQLKEYAKNVVGRQGKNLTKQIMYVGNSKSIFGDASPTYLTENTQWDIFGDNDGCSEPRVIPATFIKHIFPEARVILMLRDPVERLYSRFLANVPYVYEYENHTSSLFHTLVVQAVQAYQDCFSKLSLRQCAYNTTLFTSSVVRLSEGMYSVFLEDWLRVFHSDQMLILKFEEYTHDMQNHIAKVFEFLGLDRMDDFNVLKLAELPVVRKGKKREEEGFILPQTVSLLYDFYKPFNLKLADMLGDDKWLFERDVTLQTGPVAPLFVPGVPEPPPALQTVVGPLSAFGAPVAAPVDAPVEAPAANPDPLAVNPVEEGPKEEEAAEDTEQKKAETNGGEDRGEGVENEGNGEMNLAETGEEKVDV